MSDLGEVITTARLAHGLTQAELANAAGITQAALSRYENGLRHPDKDSLNAIAKCLKVTADFLLHAERARAGMAVDAHMRRRATAPPRVWRKLEAQLNMYRWHASSLFEEVTLRAEQQVPTFDPFEIPPEDAARLVRQQWKMPIGPVRTLTKWMESAGCLLISKDFGSTRVDGLSQWIRDCPVVMLNSTSPIDRLRLTIAHELGHLVLHSSAIGSDDIEAEANAFAAEFLMPADVIRPSLRNLKLGKLLDLKREYGVSMQALVERAFQLDLIGRAQRTNLYKSFSARGWRTREPGSDELPSEQPEFPKVIADSLIKRGLNEREIAQIAGFSDPKANDLFRAVRLHVV